MRQQQKKDKDENTRYTWIDRCEKHGGYRALSTRDDGGLDMSPGSCCRPWDEVAEWMAEREDR